jgi:hypothetical protein
MNPMLGLDIFRLLVDAPFGYFQGRVAKYPLQTKHIATTGDVRKAERMSKLVKAPGIGHAGGPHHQLVVPQ